MQPLDGSRLKIRRAIDEIERLALGEDALRQDANYTFWSEFNPKSGKYIQRVRIGVSPDPLWGVYIGEIAHNLRSALDGLVYELTLLDGGTPTRYTQFPILLVGKHIEGKKVRRRSPEFRHIFWGQKHGDGLDMINGLSLSHKTDIERLQPYKRGRGGRNCPLYWLKQINNTDKHRLVQVLDLGVAMTENFVTTYFPEHRGDFQSVPYVVSSIGVPELYLLPTELEDGTRIAELAEDVEMQANFTPLIAFGDSCRIVKGKPAIPCLHQIADDVSSIIEFFALKIPHQLSLIP